MGGVGWAQWTGLRRRQFEAWAASHNLDPRSDEASYRYLTEGDPEFAGAVAAVKREKTIQGAMQAFESAFERARIKAYSSRMRYAIRAINAKPASMPSARLPATDFHKALETIRAAKPLTPWRQSMTEHHDHRALNQNVEIKVAGTYPIHKTEYPLERAKNATLIRNTTATAS